METNNEIDLVKDKPQQIQVAIDPNAPLMVQIIQLTQQGIKLDVEYIKGLLEVKREIEGDVAKAAYAHAFTAAQADIGGVVKTRKNKQTNSMYAGLDDVIEMSKTVCATHGFSITFSEGVTEVKDHIRLCATILHKDGHKEPCHYDVPLGGVGIKGVVMMTAIHAKATSVSYGQRYLLCMIWNIPTKDVDGNQPPAPPKNIPVTDIENEAITKAIAAIAPAEVGFIIDRGHIRALLLAGCRPRLVPGQEDKLSAWLMKHSDKDLYMPDNRDEFTQSQGIFPDEEETQVPHGDAWEGEGQ